jgi:poly(3-hydroxybutyrate) depolymerase
MPIGEFGAAPTESAAQEFVSTPLYWMYEAGHAALRPARMAAEATAMSFRSPFNPLSYTPFGRKMAAMSEVFERTTRRYGKPEFGITSVETEHGPVAITEEVVWQKPFCRLLHFARGPSSEGPLPKLLIVAPLSGHYATLLRGTAEAMLQKQDVYITDWANARLVPLADGSFDLDDYIDYVIEMIHQLDGECHVMAVCQPAVPVLAATALMEADGDPRVPRSIVLMGGPIDTRRNPTAVNNVAQQRGIEWFRRHVISWVPFPHPGMMRPVYPGFLQLSGFVGMNFDRHVTAHQDYFRHLVDGDGDSAEKHRDFYDEYLAVMDLTAEFYLQTVDTVFVRQALPKGEMMHRGRPVDPSKIRRVALMTVEGERDDISGVGQTQAAHDLCVNLPPEKKLHHLQMKVGHYGVFNGSRFKNEIVPRISDFIAANEPGAARPPVSGNGAHPIPSEIAPVHAASDGVSAVFPDPVGETGVLHFVSGEPEAINGAHPAPSAVVATEPAAGNGISAALPEPVVGADDAALVSGEPAALPQPPAANGTQLIPAEITPVQAAASSTISVAIPDPMGEADDLTLISGIGERVEQLLNEAGIYHFWQLAKLSPADIGALDRKLPIPGRVVRDRWVAQASELAGTH